MNDIDPQYIHQSGRNKGKINQKALQTGTPKGTFMQRDPHPTNTQFIFTTYRTNRKSTEHWVDKDNNFLPIIEGAIKQHRLQTGNPRGTYKRQDPHPTDDRYIYNGWKYNRNEENWTTPEKIEKEKANRNTYRIKTKDIPNIKFRKNLSKNVSEALRYYTKTKSTKTIKSNTTTELIGCSKQHLKNHMESLFKEGMSWDNMGRGGWHIDHIIPCAFFSAFDLSKPSIQKLCFHYTNLQPMWESDNYRKSNNLPPILAITILTTLTTHH
jgi:hypothetical protein